MYQSVPKPPIPPGNPRAFDSHLQWGIWPKMKPARWGIWLSCQNVCQSSEAKGFRNRPLPSSLVPLFQNESKCETFQMKMSSACSFIFMQIKVIFIRMVSHLDSLWNRGTWELGSGLYFDSAREPRSRVIALVDSTWVFLFLSFYIVRSWNMPLFKVWSEDKLNKKFVVAENFAELVSRVALTCLEGGGFDPLWSSKRWGIWPSKLAT